MGYRSEVMSAIAMPSEDFVVATITKMMVEGIITPQDLEDGYNQSILYRTTVYSVATTVTDYDKGKLGYVPPPYQKMCIWEYEDSEIKWYENTPWVKHWEYILQEATNNGLPHVFLRIGDDDSDVQRDVEGYDRDLLKLYLLRSGALDASADESTIFSWVSQYGNDLDQITDWYRVYTSIDVDHTEGAVHVPLSKVLSNKLRGNADESDNESTISAA